MNPSEGFITLTIAFNPFQNTLIEFVHLAKFRICTLGTKLVRFQFVLFG